MQAKGDAVDIATFAGAGKGSLRLSRLIYDKIACYPPQYYNYQADQCSEQHASIQLHRPSMTSANITDRESERN